MATGVGYINLDDDIAQAFQVVGLLLVFIFAYFSFVSAQVWKVLDDAVTKSSDSVQKQRHLSSNRRNSRSLTTVAALTVPVVAILTPLVLRVLSHWSWTNTVRTGLVTAYAFLILLLLLIFSMRRKIVRDNARFD